MQANMTSQLVTDALMMALHRRGRPGEVLHHSDQGSQYTGEQFQMLLADAGIICSMSKRGDCWDNAAMESFFSTLQTERLSRRTYRSRDDSPRRTSIHSHSIINRSPKPAWLKGLAVIEKSLYRRLYRQKRMPFNGAGLRGIGLSSISFNHTQ